MTPDRSFRGDFSAAILAQVLSGGKVKIAVIGVFNKEVLDRLKAEGQEATFEDMDVKLLGGCADSSEEKPEETLVRELSREGFLGDCSFGETRLIDSRFIPDRNSPNKNHAQRFYLITRWDGELRTADMLEEEGDEIITPLTMFDFRDLHTLIFSTHHRPLFKAMEVLAAENRDVAEQYSDLFAAYHRKELRGRFRPRG